MNTYVCCWLHLLLSSALLVSSDWKSSIIEYFIPRDSNFIIPIPSNYDGQWSAFSYYVKVSLTEGIRFKLPTFVCGNDTSSEIKVFAIVYGKHFTPVGKILNSSQGSKEWIGWENTLHMRDIKKLHRKSVL